MPTRTRVEDLLPGAEPWQFRCPRGHVQIVVRAEHFHCLTCAKRRDLPRGNWDAIRDVKADATLEHAEVRDVDGR